MAGGEALSGAAWFSGGPARILLFSFVLLLPELAFAQSARLAEAVRFEKAGEKAASLRIYKSLAADPQSSTEFYPCMEGIIRLEADVDSLVDSARLLLEKARQTPPPAGLAGKYAGIAELSGDLETAAGLYRIEFGVSESGGSLDSAIALYIEMNDLETAGALISECRTAEQKTRFQAEASLQRGDARSALESFAASGPHAVALPALFGRYNAAVSLGDRDEMVRAAQALAAEFPLSPESAIANASIQGERGGTKRILSSPVPSQFLGAAPAPSPPADAGARAPEESARKVSVQAGSYLVRDNAEDMVKVLREKGFPAVVREQEISGRIYFKALAAAGTDIIEAKRVLEELRSKGFDGVLFFD